MKFLKATVKFVPVVILAGLMIAGQDALLAAPIAAVAAVIIAKVTEGLNFKERQKASVTSQLLYLS